MGGLLATYYMERLLGLGSHSWLCDVFWYFNMVESKIKKLNNRCLQVGVLTLILPLSPALPETTWGRLCLFSLKWSIEPTLLFFISPCVWEGAVIWGK
jgi:hypothetical protein